MFIVFSLIDLIEGFLYCDLLIFIFNCIKEIKNYFLGIMR